MLPERHALSYRCGRISICCWLTKLVPKLQNLKIQIVVWKARVWDYGIYTLSFKPPPSPSLTNWHQHLYQKRPTPSTILAAARLDASYYLTNPEWGHFGRIPYSLIYGVYMYMYYIYMYNIYIYISIHKSKRWCLRSLGFTTSRTCKI